MLLKHSADHGTGPGTIAVTQSLEENSFALVVASITHDVKAWKLYQQRVATHESSRYWKKLECDKRMHEHAKAGIKAFIKRYCRFVQGTTVEHVLNHLLEYKRDICNKPHRKMSNDHLVARPGVTAE